MAYAIAGGTTGSIGMGYPGLFPASTLDIFSRETISLENFSGNWLQTSISGSNPWNSVAVSSSGQYQIVCSPLQNNGIFYSYDYGTTWANVSLSTSSSSNLWRVITMSSTGQYITTSDGAYIYTSSAFGKSWSQSTSSILYSPTSISVSASGMYQSLCTNNGSGLGYIYTSNDYGLTWKQNTVSSLNQPWTSISISKSGQYQSVCYQKYNNNNGYIYTSSNYGATWRQIAFTTSGYNWKSICVSDSGQYQTANDSSYFWISNDYGNTWSQVTLTNTLYYTGCTSFSMSSSGQYQVGTGSSNTYILFSFDYGNTWLYISLGTNLFTSVSISASGQYISACTNGGTVWKCINSAPNGVVSVGNYPTSNKPSYGITGSIYYNSTIAGASGLQVSTGSEWSSVKSFVIEHPDDSAKYLVHGCLEGPEAGVYYRGRGEITNDEFVEIKLPAYVKNLANELTVQITPIYEGKKITTILSATEIKDNAFNVHGSNCKFHWTVFGQRTPINAEIYKNDVNVKGDGPYKWL
jgi:photosystem II stability/assembly factor-like uncharacterized protein